MYSLEKNTQVNFRTNSNLLERAKEIISEHNLDMTASFNLFLENIVQNKKLPFETDTDKEREELLTQLRGEISQSFKDLEQGRIYTVNKVRATLEIWTSSLIPEYVQNQLRTIKNYIETIYFSEQAGINTVNNILHGLERLTIFPEAGFNADERVGKIIYPPYKTRCIVLGDYLAFYHILEDRKSIFISNIIHSKQDYIRLFKRKS